MANPTTYTVELGQAVCDLIAEGREDEGGEYVPVGLREALRTVEGAPSMSTWFQWLKRHPELADAYEAAMESRAEMEAEQILAIADDSARDWKVVGSEEREQLVPDHEVVARSRLRVNVRQHRIERMAPKRWGNKVQAELSGPDGGPIELSGTATAARVAALLEAARRRKDGEDAGDAEAE